jgi:hypothetical protein
MRRLLVTALSTIFFITAISCKEEKKEENVTDADAANTAETPTKEPDCDTDVTFQEYMEAARDGNGSEWINENGSLLCVGDLQTCVEQSHRITNNDFTKYINDHPSNASGPVYYNKPWQEIEDLIGTVECYEKYLLFNVNGNNLEMELGSFSTSQTSYSAVFFKQIKKQHNLSPTDIISFVKASVPIGTGSSTK